MSSLPPPFSRDQLLTAFATEWDALITLVTAHAEDELLQKTDAAGWNTRDHLAHLGAWLNSVIVMVRDGQPQWTGLGAPQRLFSFADYDPLNEAIRQNTIDWSFADALNLLRTNHETMVEIVSGMSDEDLLKPVDDFVAGAGTFAICFKIDGNGPHHYREHRGWIQAILDQDGDDAADELVNA